MLYDSTTNLGSGRLYTEEDAKESGLLMEEGYRLIDHLLQLD
jgi:hypothetical protein